MTETTLKLIPLSNISLIRNYRDIEPPTEKDPDVLELAESIKDKGVLQAVLVRPHKSKKDHYELIFGHRRFMASKIVGNENIPANIKEVTDDQILEIQITENLQRKDVHPMDEAIAFKKLVDEKGQSIADLMARFAKSEFFVTSRLALNNLIPEIQKLFLKGQIRLVQAEVFAKLNPEQQKSLKSNSYNSFNGIWFNADHMKKIVEKEFLRKLSSAPWDLNDKELNPKAGSCKECVKRTACMGALFQDIAKDDRCTDGKCFSEKHEKFFIKEVHNAVVTHPEIAFMKYGSEPVNKEVLKIASDYKIKILNYYDNGISESKSTGSTLIQCLIINGSNRGKYQKFYLSNQKAQKVSASASNDPTEEIEQIKERLKRSAELDKCKVHTAIVNEFSNKPETSNTPADMKDIDRGIMIYLLMDMAYIRGDIKGFPAEPRGRGYNRKYFEDLSKVSDSMLALLIRFIVNRKYAARDLKYEPSLRDTPVRIMAEYLGIDINAIEQQQKAIADRRTERAVAKIEGLKAKVPEKKSTPKKAVKKATKKKA